MSSGSEKSASFSAAAPPTERRLLTVAAVFASLVTYSFLASPVPGINEPHYVGKAVHYWNPDYCRGDLFLESANAHLVFYQTVGWLGLFLTLAQTTIVARLAAFALLAWGWTRLTGRCVAARWAPVWILWVYLAAASIGNFSGEWLVGGVEAKIFAYAFVFAGISYFAAGRYVPAGLCGGLAISYHPVVGIWSLAAVAFAVVVCRLRIHRNADESVPAPQWKQSLLAAGVLVLASLPGLVPAVGMLSEGDPQTRLKASYLQVFYRLRHHLDPMELTPMQYACYGMLLAFWIVGRRYAARNDAERFFARVVAGSTLIAAAGVLVGLGPRPVAFKAVFENVHWLQLRMTLMKFYAFRLFDLLLPIAAAVMLVDVVACRIPPRDAEGTRRSALWWAWAAFALVGIAAFVGATRAQHPSFMSASRRARWIQVCRWIEGNTPRNSLWVTPHGTWAFKWYAQRPEYVAFKDCPQDATALVEWNHRLVTLRQWGRAANDNGYTRDDLRALRRETGATHYLFHGIRAQGIEPAFTHGNYFIYRLPEADSQPSRDGTALQSGR